MGNIHENIKKDLLYLYNELYCLSQCESAGNFFDKKFLRSLKYKPEEVEEAIYWIRKKLETILKLLVIFKQ